MSEVMECIELTGEHKVVRFETIEVEHIELKDEVGFMSFDLTVDNSTVKA